MTQQQNIPDRIKNRFITEYNIKISDQWVRECIAYFMRSDPNITINQLYKDTFSQYLLADLREIGLSTVPKNLFSKPDKFQLTGKRTLQMEYMIDISESAYEQYRKIHDIKLDDAEENLNRTQATKVKRKRCLQLKLTDGHDTVTAMEHKPIPCLNTKLPPGVKILIVGPVTVINRVLFLEPHNIQVLGGEVDTLLITNAYENVLLKALKKPLVPNPKQDYKEDPVCVEPPKRSKNIQPKLMENKLKVIENIPKKTFQKPSAILDDEDDDDELLQNLNLENLPISNPTTAAQPVIDNFDMIDDEEMMNLDLDLVVSQNTKNKPTASEIEIETKKMKYDDYYDADDFMDYLNHSFGNKSTRSAASKSNKQPSTATSTATLSSKATAISTTVPEKPKIKEIVRYRICDQEYPFKFGNNRMATIDQFLELSSTEKLNRYLIFNASIKSFWKPLQVKNYEWTLGCTLKDNYSNGDLKVTFSSIVLAKLCGYEATEFYKMKQESANKPQLREEISKIILDLKATLETIKTFMIVSTAENYIDPVVIELVSQNPTCTKTFEQKVKHENLKKI